MKRSEAIDKAVELHKAKRFEEARELYRAVLALRPNDVSATHLLGLTYLDEPNWREGLALIQRAIELYPTQQTFHFNLGVGQRNHGLFEEAQASFKRATELKDDYGEAWGAWVVTQKFSERGPELDHILSQLVNDLDDDNRLFFEFAAGKILDDIGEYAEAFPHFRAGNKLHQKPWKEAEFKQTCEDLRSMADEAYFEQRKDYGIADASPIFVVGMPRSGSTLVEQILDSHSGVFGAGEVGDILGIVTEMGKRMKPSQPYPAYVPFLPEKVFRGYANSYLQRMEQLAGSAGLQAANKMPSNFLHVAVILTMFPNARIINAFRHPLDTCLSCYFQDFSSGQEFTYDLAVLGRYYNEYRTMMSHWHSVLPGRIFDLEYEALVQDPDGVAQEMIEFCGLDWEEQCLDFANNRRRVNTASTWQVRQPLYSSSIGRWRHYEAELQPLIDAIDPQYL